MSAFFVERHGVRLLSGWLINSLSLIVISLLLPFIHLSHPLAAFKVTLMLGLLYHVAKPVVMVLIAPAIVLSLGLLIPVLDVIIFQAAGQSNFGMEIGTFWQALAGYAAYRLLARVTSVTVLGIRP